MAAKRDRRKWSAGEHSRLVRIHDLWHQGKAIKEIADTLGSTVNAIGVTTVYMRRDGWDLPYRRKPKPTCSACGDKMREPSEDGRCGFCVGAGEGRAA